MKQLYLVTMSYEVIVAADSVADAHSAASSNRRSIAMDQEPDEIDVHDTAFQTVEQIPPPWRGCIPYGSDDGNKTVDEYFEAVSNDDKG